MREDTDGYRPGLNQTEQRPFGDDGWDQQWNGWWGDDPPFHAPGLVLTHHAREPQPMDGGTMYCQPPARIRSFGADDRANRSI
jgi:hypothetical protein